ncbi:MAG: hypothetical protein V3G42_13555 [Oscillospiraceae bacterium]
MLWMGLAASNLLCMSVTAVIVLLRYSRSMFPLLLPREHDSHIHIYAFDITPDNISLMSETAGSTLQKEGFSTRLQILTGICIEDMLNLVIERNRDTTNSLSAECTIIAEDTGVRVVMRDNGRHFDVTDEEMSEYSFTKFTVDRMLATTEHNAYITTTGYNRNELVFVEKSGHKNG